MEFNHFSTYKKANADKINSDPLLAEFIEDLEEHIRYAEGKPADVRVRHARKITIVPVEAFDADRIRRLRIDNELTQHLLAQLIGVDKSTIEKWESGKVKPNGSAMRLLKLIEENSNCLSEFYSAEG